MASLGTRSLSSRTLHSSRGVSAAPGAVVVPHALAAAQQQRQWQQQLPPAAAATLGSIRRSQQVPNICLQQRPNVCPQQRQVAAAAVAAAAGDAQQPWQPPQQPQGFLRLPRLSLWSLGGPLAWGYMLGYLGLMLILPISALLAKASLVPLQEFITRAAEPVAMSAYFVSFSMALLAGAVNAVFGFLLAWVLVKYEFPGKKWIDAAVDLPFALPTSVAGLTLATVYGEEGILGRFLMSLGVNVVYTRLGVAVAMIFVSFPFVVRTMQPVLQEMEKEVEEAAWSLGASPWQTFTQVLLPPLLPPLLTGTALAFSRALGEFGSVVIVSSNFPYKDLIAPVLIFQCLEQYDFVGATVIGTVLLLISLVMMVGVNWLQSYSQRFRK